MPTDEWGWEQRNRTQFPRSEHRPGKTVDIEFLDGESIVVTAGIPVEEWLSMANSLEWKVRNIDKNLAAWWAIHEYAKLGGDGAGVHA
jgi:hypothetical protein